MSIEQAKIDTYEHIRMVQHKMNLLCKELLSRAENHDKSKLESPEVEIFGNAPDLSSMEYNSPAYKESLDKIKPALDHHYANNRHHPQFFKNGVNDMNILDVVEMLCDWASSCKRNKNGNLRKSIEVNGDRFGMSPQLVKILENSVPLVEETT